jgi:hypothetical protein
VREKTYRLTGPRPARAETPRHNLAIGRVALVAWQNLAGCVDSPILAPQPVPVFGPASGVCRLPSGEPPAEVRAPAPVFVQKGGRLLTVADGVVAVEWRAILVVWEQRLGAPGNGSDGARDRDE